MGKMIICENCGGEFDEELVRCPYCGTGYLPAEENEYMENLDGIRKELAGYPEEGDASIHRRLSKAARMVLLVIAVIFLLILGSIWLSSITGKRSSREKKEEFLRNQGIVTEQQKELER